jgi:hypothetical protein
MTLLLVCSIISADFPVCDQPEGQYQPCVMYLDSLYYVFWSDHRNAMTVCGTRVLSDGTVIDTVGHFLYYASTLRDVRAATDGTNLLVVFRYGC